MKISNSLTAGFLIAFITSGIAVASPLLNGGFESGNLSPWYQAGNGSLASYIGSPWTVSTEAAHSGLYGAVADGNQEIRQDFAGVAGSDVTNFSFWIRRPNADPINDSNHWVLVTLFYADNTSQWAFTTLGSSNWTQYDFTSHINDAKTLTGVSTWGYVDQQTPNVLTYVDDFRLTLQSEAVPEPASFVLLGTGLLGFLIVRRQRK